MMIQLLSIYSRPGIGKGTEGTMGKNRHILKLKGVTENPKIKNIIDFIMASLMLQK